MKNITSNQSAKREFDEIKEIIQEITQARSLDDVKDAANKLGDKLPLLASLGKYQINKACEETKGVIQESPFIAVATSFLAGALLAMLLKK